MDNELIDAARIALSWLAGLFTANRVLVFVVAAQVFVAIGVLLAQRQQVRIAIMKNRMTLYDAINAFARSAANLADDEDIYGWDRVTERFDDVARQLESVYPVYANLFDKRTRRLMKEIVDDCWLLRGQMADVDVDEAVAPRQLSREERGTLERALIGSKLEKLGRLVQRHLDVGRRWG